MTRNFLTYVLAYYKWQLLIDNGGSKKEVVSAEAETQSLWIFLTRSEREMLHATGFFMTSVEGLPEQIIKYIMGSAKPLELIAEPPDDGRFSIAEMVDILTQHKRKEKE